MLAEEFAEIVALARLAPSPQNSQPVRWRLRGSAILIGCDAAALPVSDPDGAQAGLACGAAAEATMLALSGRGLGGGLADLWAENDRQTLPGLRLAARITFDGTATADPLLPLLDRRYTHRGGFAPGPVDLFGWGRRDAILLADAPSKIWIADLNDGATLARLRHPGVRHEMLSWMRLSRGHPRSAHDGLSRAALRMSPGAALRTRAMLGPLWRPADLIGLAASLVSEAEATRGAALIALFHRPAGESPVTSGRASLRLLLEAAQLGMAGWPMTALTEDLSARAEICDRHGLGPDRRLLQAIRLGVPPVPPPPRARRPVSELIV